MGQKRVGAWACFLTSATSKATNPTMCRTMVMATRIKAARIVESIVSSAREDGSI